MHTEGLFELTRIEMRFTALTFTKTFSVLTTRSSGRLFRSFPLLLTRAYELNYLDLLPETPAREFGKA